MKLEKQGCHKIVQCKNGFALIKGLNQSKTSKKTVFLPFPEANLWQRQENFARIARNGFGMASEWLRNGFALIKGQGLNQSKISKKTIS